MADNKSLDLHKQIIAALVSDVQTLHGEVFTPKAALLTRKKVCKRLDLEGMSFLTKALPRLGKALDRALSGEVQLDSASLDVESLPNSKLPKLFGELFQLVFSHDGDVLPTPCVRSIKTLRQVLYLYYKYELPYDSEQEQQVLSKFIQTEKELESVSRNLSLVAKSYEDVVSPYSNTHGLNALSQPVKALSDWYLGVESKYPSRIIRGARLLLFEALRTFNHLDIYPCHGPGAVSTGERFWDKWTWTNIPDRITQTYPADSYYYANAGHVCDRLQEFASLKSEESSAKVILVPKDSRGPRLISCEPLEFQWIQQGLGRALMEHVEGHPLTRYAIHFTDQRPNQIGALLGSSTGGYATLDLNEASDRVSVGLVQLLFPEPLKTALLNCRSLSTRLPDGTKLALHKYAPMGSALCFPVLALVVWAIVTAELLDADPTWYTKLRTSEDFASLLDAVYHAGVLVYGDDVVVQTAKAANAITALETFGLKVNRDKSFTSGLFRESCGVDAYNGVEVTPVRFRTVWTSHRSPESYVSWIEYSNSCYRRKYFNLYDQIVRNLTSLYGEIPPVEWGLPVPSLIEVPDEYVPKISRSHPDKGPKAPCFQKKQWKVWDIRTRAVNKEIDGWSMLLRYFAEGSNPRSRYDSDLSRRSDAVPEASKPPFRVRSYTKRRAIKLVRCWR